MRELIVADFSQPSSVLLIDRVVAPFPDKRRRTSDSCTTDCNSPQGLGPIAHRVETRRIIGRSSACPSASSPDVNIVYMPKTSIVTRRSSAGPPTCCPSAADRAWRAHSEQSGRHGFDQASGDLVAAEAGLLPQNHGQAVLIAYCAVPVEDRVLERILGNGVVVILIAVKRAGTVRLAVISPTT